jgi:hypothetical protein
MFGVLRQATERLSHSTTNLGSLSRHTQQLDRNDYAYYDNYPPDYEGSIAPNAGFDFDYFGYGLAPSGTVPNGTLEHSW